MVWNKSKRSINVTIPTWKELAQLKIAKDLCSISATIDFLLEEKLNNSAADGGRR